MLTTYIELNDVTHTAEITNIIQSDDMYDYDIKLTCADENGDDVPVTECALTEANHIEICHDIQNAIDSGDLTIGLEQDFEDAWQQMGYGRPVLGGLSSVKLMQVKGE